MVMRPSQHASLTPARPPLTVGPVTCGQRDGPGPPAAYPRVMTSIEVDPHALAALAGSLGEVADDLRWQATRAAEQAWALGPGDSAGALASVLGDFEHQRQVLGRELDDLAGRVTSA